jgi:ankyrin repeat protein
MAKQAKPNPHAALVKAISDRDEKAVRKLLNAGGVDWSAKDDKGRTLLQAARYHRSTEIEVILIDAGAPLERADLNLYWAVSTKRADIVKKFIDAGADVEMKAIGGTPLDSAASWNLPEIVQLLVDAGADIDAESEFNGTPLAQAIDNNASESALILIRAGAKIDTPDNSDTTLLISAIGYGNTEVALALIDAGADVNARGRVHYLGKQLHRNQDLGANPTPLVLAARMGDEKVVDALLARGADIHARDEDGKSALEWAKAKKHAAIGKRLEAETRKKPPTRNLDEELIFAADRADRPGVVRLLDEGANIDARDTRSKTSGFTPLMLAVRRGDEELATLLLARGAAVDARDTDGEPPSDEARKQMKFLIAHGAEDYITSAGIKLGRTPLHMAAAAGKIELAQLLLEHGADVNAVDRIDQTPVKIAKYEQHAKLLKLLKDAGGTDRAAATTKAPPPSKLEAKATAKQKPKSTAATKRKKSKPRPLPKPDFSAAAKTPPFAKALAEMKQICGSKPQPMSGIDGVFTFHVHSSKKGSLDLRKLHQDFLRKGFYAFSTDATSDAQLALAPTADKYALIAAFQTNGANYDLGPEEIAQWLRDLEEEVPFILTGIGWDFLKGHFNGPRRDPHDLAQRMYEFCPDIVDQGVGEVDTLAESLAERDDLFFWWD